MRNTGISCPITEAAGTHMPGHVTCAACIKEKDMLIAIVGGQGMTKLFTKVSKVTGDDQYESAVTKVRQGITGLAEVNCISLKCDRCEFVTKSCRKSRAKKHLTSHCEKYHREDEDVHHVVKTPLKTGIVGNRVFIV